VHVTCTPAARTFVKFGTEGKLIGSTSPTPSAGGEFDIPLSGQMIRAGSKISYSVVAIGTTGEQLESAAQTFSTKGYTVRIKALDKNQKSLSNRQFTLHSDPITAKSDAGGVVTFANVSPGRHTLELGGKDKFTQELDVEDTLNVATDGTQYAGTQNFSITFVKAAKTSNVFKTLTIIVVLLAIAGALVWVLVGHKGGMWPPSGLAAFGRRILKRSSPNDSHSKVISGGTPGGGDPHVAPPPKVISPQTAPKPSGKETTPRVG
jgi:hypothetical protein